MNSKHDCALCAKKATKWCTGCYAVLYCCREHQKKHWPEHKPACKGQSYDLKALQTFLYYSKMVLRLSKKKLTPANMMWAYPHAARRELSWLMSKKAYVKESPVHGSGLFALRDLGKWDVISLYPVHFAFNFDRGETSVSPTWTGPPLTFERYMELHNTYSFRITKTEDIPFDKLVASPDCLEDHALAHMANDAALGILLHSDPTPENCAKYIEECARVNNAAFVFAPEVHQTFLVSLRPISAYEEIFVTYGPGYVEEFIDVPIPPRMLPILTSMQGPPEIIAAPKPTSRMAQLMTRVFNVDTTERRKQEENSSCFPERE